MNNFRTIAAVNNTRDVKNDMYCHLSHRFISLMIAILEFEMPPSEFRSLKISAFNFSKITLKPEYMPKIAKSRDITYVIFAEIMVDPINVDDENEKMTNTTDIKCFEKLIIDSDVRSRFATLLSRICLLSF
jgi:hypothetical protein